MQKKLKRSVVISLITLSGSLVIFSWVVLMNRFITSPDRIKKASSISFVVPQIEKQEKKQAKPKKQKRETRNQNADLAPLPDLGDSFSGISLALPDFMEDGGVNKSLLGNLENVAMTEGAVDTPPIPESLSVPYPERAKQRDLEGSVMVSVQVSDTGRVTNIQILESSPPGVFDEAVKKASESWVFTPGKYQGMAVSTWVNIPIPFKLN